MKVPLFFLGFYMLFTTCSTTQQPADRVDDSLTTWETPVTPTPTDTAKNRLNLSGSWEMISMPGNESDWSKIPLLNLDVAEGTFTGNTGCNGMSGRFLVDGARLTFDNEIITTKMACIGKYNEKVFLENLLRVNNYSINDTTLQLRQLDTVKMVFKRRPV